MIQHLQHVAIAAIVALFFTAISCARYLLLRTDEEIFRAVRPHTLYGLDSFVDHGGYNEDTAFWRASRGYSGLWLRVHNAACFVRLLQRLAVDGLVEPIDVHCIAQKAILIVIFTLAAPLEEPVRILMREMPHVCARTATNLFAEMEAMMEAILSGNIGVLERLRAVV